MRTCSECNRTVSDLSKHVCGYTTCSNFKLYCEYGKYIDFVSLYPTVNFFKEYPVGHPVKIYNPKSYNPKWFGFIQCKIEAPGGLYHPVLPVRLRDKLLFPLCWTCAITQQQEKCTHLPDERALTGTWCTNEIALALRKGYCILEI